MHYPVDDVSQSEVQSGDKIKVSCHGCGARYQVSSDKVRGRRFRATCKRCGGIIVARCTGASVLSRTARPAPADAGDGPGDGSGARDPGQEEGWYAVLGGKAHGPISAEQVRQYFEGARITERTYLWRSGDHQWRRLEEVTEFADLLAEEPTNFYQTAEGGGGLDAEEQRRSAPGGGAGADGTQDSPWDAVPGVQEEDVGEETTVHLVNPADGPAGEQSGLEPASRDSEEPTHYRYATPYLDEPQGASAGAPVVPAAQPGGQASWGREGPYAGSPGPAALPSADNPWVTGPQPRWPEIPRVAPRKAWLPAPTGIPRHPTGSFNRPAAAPLPLPSPVGGRPVPAPIHGPPGSARGDATPGLPGPEGVLPAPPKKRADETPDSAVSLDELMPGGVPAAPQPASAGPELPLVQDSLLNYSTDEPSIQMLDTEGAVVSPSLLIPPKEPFWTGTKIAVAAVVGGVLMVAAAVGFGIHLARSRSQGGAGTATRPAELARAPGPAPSSVAASRGPGAARGGGPAAGAPAPAAAEKENRPASASTTGKGASPAPTAAKPTPAAAKPAPEAAAAAGSSDRAASSGSGGPERAAEPREESPARAKKAEAASRPAGKTVKKTRTSHKAAAASGSSSRKRASSDVDALLAGNRSGRTSREGSAAKAGDADDILASSTRRRSSSSSAARPSGKDDADDILATSTRRRSRKGSSAGAAPAEAALPLYPSKDQIQNTMRRAMPRVSSCYEKHGESGVIQVSVFLKPTGAADATVVGKFAGTATAFCVLAGVNQLTFPRFSGKAFRFTYPYQLK